MLALTSSLLILITFFGTILVQVFVFPFLYLGDLINHPLIYLSLLFLGLLLWCFGNDAQS
jgi:hypothetical protein